MASDQNVLEQLLRIKLDKAAADAAKQDLQVLKAGFVDLAATAEKGSNAATTLTKKLSELNRAAQIDKLGKDFGTMATKIGDADKAAQLLAGRLADIGASGEEIGKAGSAFANAQAGAGAGGSGGGLGLNGLRRTGSALSQLGLEPLGSGVSTLGGLGQVVKEFQLLSQVIPGVSAATAALTPLLGATTAGFAATSVVLAPIIAIVLAVGLGVKALSDELERSEKAFKAELDALKAETDLKNQNIELARTRTAEQNRQQATDDEQRFQNQEELLTKLKAKKAEIDKEYADLGSNLDPVKRKDLATKGDDAQKAIDEASKTLIDLGTSIDNTVKVLGPEIDQREKDALAIKAEQDALKAKEQAIADNGKVEIEARTLAKTATEDQVKALLESISIQREALKKQATDSQKLFDETADKAKNGDKAAADALGEIGKTTKNYTDQIVVLDARTKALTDTTLAAAIANDKAKDAAKSLEDAGKAAVKYADDVKTINDKYYQEQIDAAQKLSDKQTEIQDQAVQAAEQLLQSLQVKYADLSKNLGRSLDDQQTKAAQDQLQKQINFQRSETSAEKKFQDQIVSIKRKAKENDLELELDRDFAGLAKSRRQTASQISDVTQQAQHDRQDRLQAYRDQQEDSQRAFADERALKIEQYKRQIADAQEAYTRDQRQLIINANRALAAASLAEQKELQVLNDKHTKEITAKYNAAVKEIDLAKKTSDIRNDILTAEYQHALAVFQGISRLGLPAHGYTPTMANGGNLSAGMSALVNEPGSSGNESVTGGGKTYKLPGVGLFKSFGSSTVNPNKSGDSQMITLAPTFNITNGSPTQVMQVIDAKLEQTVRRIFQVKASA